MKLINPILNSSLIILLLLLMLGCKSDTFQTINDTFQTILIFFTVICFMNHTHKFSEHSKHFSEHSKALEKIVKLKCGTIDIIFPENHIIIDDIKNEITVRAYIKNSGNSSFIITGINFDIIKSYPDNLLINYPIKSFDNIRYLNCNKDLYYVIPADSPLEFYVTSDKESHVSKNFTAGQFANKECYEFNSNDIKEIKDDKNFPIVFVGKITYLDAMGDGWRKTFRFRLGFGKLKNHFADVYVEQIYKSPT